MSFTDIRNVHVKGHIIICTDKAGSSDRFLTCGTEGAVYVWDEKTVNERESIDIKSVADSTHSACAWHGENVFVGMTTTDLLTGVDKKVVGQCTMKDLESCRQLFTFSLEVTAVDASENYVVAGGSDFTVKKINLKTHEQYDRVDTNGEILCVAIDPNEQVYAVACCDGTVSMYNLLDNEKLSVHEHMFSAFGDLNVESPRHAMTWSKDGSELYVPSQGSVKVIKRDGWILATDSFKCDGIATDTFSSSCISKDGHYLCASTMSNKLLVWKIESRSVVAQYDYKRKDKKTTVSCVKFSPFNDRDILVADVDEGFCMLRDAIPKVAAPVPQETMKADSSNDQENDSESEEDDDDDDEDEVRVNRTTKKGFLDDEAEDDNDTRMSVDIGEIKKKYGFGDDTTGKLEDFGFTVSDEAPHASTKDVVPSSSYAAPPPPEVIAYEPPTIPSFFVSGASPDHLTQRYLKWNSYGIVRTYSGEDGSSIEISFHDVSIHPTIVLDNGVTEYVLADISDQAVALASKAEEKGDQSELLVIHVSSWDSESRRWTAKLPTKESALDVLVSQELVFLVTEKRNIRVFSLTGTQRHIISHPSPILTTACFGSNIAVCSISGGDYYEKGKHHEKPNFQHSVTIYNVDSRQWYRKRNTVNSVDVPVAKREHLVWLAFTNYGQLVSMDSSYTIRLLSPAGFWLPIFDGTHEVAGKSDAIWPIAVTEGRQRQIRYLYCKGSKYPLIAVKMAPLITTWTLPYCAPESDKSKLEQDLFLNELQQSETSSRSTSELMELASGHLQCLVKLFALACKSERDGRAAELAGMVTSAKGIQTMCNYAAKLKKSTLADKVAAKGRENLASHEISTPSSSLRHDIDEDPAPRRMSIKRRATASTVVQQPLFMDDDDVTPTVPTTFEDDVPETQPPQSVSQADSLLNDSTIVPLPKITRNPFRKSPKASLDTSSVFDSDSSFIGTGKKRAAEEETPKPTATKQMKLSFGSASAKGKENGRTAYSLWLESQEETLRSTFSGSPEDFMKFCTQQFRMLPPAEKKEWKSRAESSN